MKLPTLLGLLGLRRDIRQLREAAQSIAQDLKRLVDAYEGVTPLRESPPAPEDRRGDILTHPPGYFERLDEIERWFVLTHHRQPSAEELIQELDGLPIDPEEAAAALQKKWMRHSPV